MSHIRAGLAIIALCIVGAGCSSPVTGTPAAEGAGPSAAAPAPPAPAPPGPVPDGAAPNGSADGGECPLAASDLSSATSLSWELRRTEKDYPLETAEGLKATVCVFTTSDRPQFGGDPLVMRVDTISGPDAAKLRSNFERVCTENGGELAPTTAAEGAEVCRSRGSVTDGNIADGDRYGRRLRGQRRHRDGNVIDVLIPRGARVGFLTPTSLSS